MANINDPKIREKYLKKVAIPTEVEENIKEQEEKAQYRNYDDNTMDKLRERTRIAQEKGDAAIGEQQNRANSPGKLESSPLTTIQKQETPAQIVLIAPSTISTEEGFYDEFSLQLNTLTSIQKILFEHIYSLCQNKNFSEHPLIRANDLAITLGLKKISVIKGIMYLENKNLLKIEETRRGRGGFIKLSIPDNTITRIKQLKAS